MTIYIYIFMMIYALYLMQQAKFNPILTFRYKKIRLSRFSFKFLRDEIKINLLNVIVFVTLFLFSAFRFQIGWDYNAYYETIVYNRITNISENGEILNLFLIEISRFIKMPNFYFFSNSLIQLFSIHLMLKKKSNNYILSFLIFLLFPLFYLNSFSVIRIFTSITIVFLGLKYLEEDKNLYYLLMVIIAFFFHKSAIISIVFLFLKKINLSKIKTIIFVALGPIIGNIINYLIINYFPRYSTYLNETDAIQGTKAVYVVVFSAVLFFIKRNKMMDKMKNFNLYYNNYIFGVIIYLTFLKMGTLGHRLSLFGTINLIILFPYYMDTFENKRKRQIYITALILVLFLSYFYTIYVGKNTYLPYRTIWNK